MQTVRRGLALAHALWDRPMMISFTLHCPDNHRFDSWFQSAAAFDALVLGRHINCPVCGSTKLEKALMAPAVRPGRSQVATPLQSPANAKEAALAALRREVEANSNYVGLNFVAEARAMHVGDAPERSIYGEARIEDARKLVEDGVPVAPLPFMPMRKVN
jgi:hypothetical protein